MSQAPSADTDIIIFIVEMKSTTLIGQKGMAELSSQSTERLEPVTIRMTFLGILTRFENFAASTGYSSAGVAELF